MRKIINIKILLFLCLMGAFDFTFCQNAKDTTLRLNLAPDSSRFCVNLRTEFGSQQKYKKNVTNCRIDGNTFVVTCKNTPDNINKAKNAARASADVYLFAEEEQEEVHVKELEVAPVVKLNEKYNPDIDSFLNIEDESIFSDSIFILLDKQRIHPRSYKYYCLIHDIYKFGELLKIVQESKVQHLEQTKKMIEEMTNLANQITGMEYELERSFLSQKQKDYYNGLYDQYVEIWNIFNK